MTQGHALIETVAAGFVYALAGGFIATRLRLPPLLGYLMAGIAVGPFTRGIVVDGDIAGQLAEIGVILLMFGVGMHISLRDLLSVRALAIPGALIQILACVGFGIGVALMWGWGLGGGVVLGFTLAIASTVVLLRALETAGAMGSRIGQIAIGWLVLEDLLTVVVLVALPPLAPMLGGHAAEAVADGASAWMGLAIVLGKLVAFVGVMLLVGSRALPWLLAQAVRTGSREMFTLTVMAIALGIAFVSAELLGLSYALGAFFAGIVINASDHSHRAEKDAQPLQDVFAVLFFVSVGMLFDPTILLREPVRVLVLTAAIVIGKPLLTYLTLRLFRQSVDISSAVAAGLGQIGEFSFILIGVGLQLGLLPKEAQAPILGAALLSITCNPFLFRLLPYLRRRLEGRIRG
jgi:CPA2 family monovalent cation:H+ antiporter-2